MSGDLNARRAEFEAEAVRLAAGRKPKFGDLMRNPWAGEGNPTAQGYFVKSKRVTGNFNPGLWYEMTDGEGKFWAMRGDTAMFAEAAPLPAEQPSNPVPRMGADKVRDVALDLLSALYSAYEDGVSCYEDPEESSGYVGNAVLLDGATEQACIDLLNKHRPRIVGQQTKGGGNG